MKLFLFAFAFVLTSCSSNQSLRKIASTDDKIVCTDVLTYFDGAQIRFVKYTGTATPIENGSVWTFKLKSSDFDFNSGYSCREVCDSKVDLTLNYPKNGSNPNWEVKTEKKKFNIYSSIYKNEFTFAEEDKKLIHSVTCVPEY